MVHAPHAGNAAAPSGATVALGAPESVQLALRARAWRGRVGHANAAVASRSSTDSTASSGCWRSIRARLVLCLGAVGGAAWWRPGSRLDSRIRPGSLHAFGRRRAWTLSVHARHLEGVGTRLAI